MEKTVSLINDAGKTGCSHAKEKKNIPNVRPVRKNSSNELNI